MMSVCGSGGFRVCIICNLALLLMIAIALPRALAEDGWPKSAKEQPDSFPNERRFVQHVLADQAAIWSSPAHLKGRDLKWLVPAAGALTGLIVTDRTSSFQIYRDHGPSFSKNVSDGGVLAAAGVTGALYLWGRATNDDRAREAGVLSTESVIDSLLVTEALKFSTQRDRPYQDHGAGEFFSHGQSFPSEHATGAWSGRG